MSDASHIQNLDDQSSRASARERLIWGVIFALAIVWIAFRASTSGMGRAYVQVEGDQVTEATYADYDSGVALYSPSRTIGIWVSALLTLAIFSFLYRDNVFYKLAEAIFVGVSAAYYMVIGFWTVIVPNLLGNVIPHAIHNWSMPGLAPVRNHDWYLYLIPLVLGVMLLWRLAPRGQWIARWPLAFIIGTTAGLRLVGFLQADFLSQINASVVPVIVIDETTGFDFWASVRSLLLILSVLATLVYFFFSIEHKGAVGAVSRGGVWVLMITFGASFGFTVMGRIALLVSRFQFLFDDWLWLIDPGDHRLGL
jgi:hypothetical protein